MSARRPAVDPVSLGIMWDRLIAIADEILLSIVRTSFSVGVREAWDLACVLFDARGRSLAQGTRSMPAFIGTAPFTMAHMLRRYPAETLQPGDVIVTNDPWMGTGHTPDICVTRPVFFGQRLVGFVMTISHLPDVGGAGLSVEAREIFEEGLVLPVCKLYHAGSPNEELFELLRLNVRVPDQVMGDLMADVTGAEVGERLIAEFMAEYGIDDLDALADGIIGQSESAIRARIADMPDGVYENRIAVEAIDREVTLACELTVAGDHVTIDFEGTGPTVPAAINVPLCYTRAFSAYTIKCLTAPGIPNNQGAVLPLEVTAPAGCILDARRPSPTGGRHVIGWFVVPLIMGALADAVPERVQAEPGMASLFIVQGTRPDGRALSTQYFLAGGLGAMAGLDGRQTTPAPTNNAVVPSEVWEEETGMTVLRRALLADSGGAGEFRGGPGQEAVLRNDSGHPLTVSLFGLRTEFAARGYRGGQTGWPRSFVVNGAPVPPKGRQVLAPGDTLAVREAGGGGYGDPRKRDPKHVLQDVIDGIVSVEGAWRDYGVTVDLSARSARRL
jgi:N-methylhydantoinase B